MRTIRLLLLVLPAILVGAVPSDAIAQPAPLTLGIALNQTTLRPGDTLDLGVTVNNPGGGPAADFYVLIVLPDGSTTVSVRLGAPIVFGALGNLRSLVPAAANIGLGGPFTFGQSVFRYTFAGNEPSGNFTVYFAAVRAGAFGNGSIDAGELLALQTQSFLFTTQPGVPTVTIDQTAVLLPQLSATRQLTARALDGFGKPFQGPITWTSSRPTQVSVDANGQVRAMVANGSSQITAHITGAASAPLLVIATTTPAGATVVTDAQIVGAPVETAPDAEPSVDNTYRVVLRGVPPPAVGALLINTGEQPVAGRVVAVDVSGSDVTVTLGFASLRELFPTLEIDEVIDLANAPVSINPALSTAYNIQRTGNTFSFTPKPGAPFGAADGRSGPAAGAVGTRAMFPFECKTDVGLPIRLSAPPVFSVSASPTIDVRYFASGGLQHWIVRATPTVKLEGGVTVTAGFEGILTCTAELFVFRVPVGGPLSLVIGGLVPVEAGFELAGKLTVATFGITSKVEAATNTQTGFVCDAAGDCDFFKDLGSPTLTHTETINSPALGDVRLEPSFTLFGQVTASIGNPIFKSLRLDAFRARVGGKYSASFASPASQIADTTYRSDYKVSLEAKATVGTKLGEVARRLGLITIAAVELSFSPILGRSPVPASANPVIANRASFNVGDAVTFRVALDPSTVNFFPVIGPYNVKQVVLVRGRTNLSIVGTLVATPGQSEFTFPFTPTGFGRADEFTAFMITTLAPLQVFALEIGQAVGAEIVVSPTTASVSTGGTKTFTAAVTGLSSNAVVWSTDGGSISQAGIYTAPTIGGVFLVRATSAVNPAVFGEAIVTVTSAPAPFVITLTEATVGWSLGAGTLDVSDNFSNAGLVVFADRTITNGGSSASMANTRASVVRQVNTTALDLVLAGQTNLATSGTSGGAAVNLQARAGFQTLQPLTCSVTATVAKSASNPNLSFGFLVVVSGPGGEKARLTSSGAANFACPAGQYDVQTSSSPFTGGTATASMNYSVRVVAQ